MKQTNKKGIIFSVLAVFALVALIIGTTFALYSFTGTGSTVNQINTGSISMQYQESADGVISLTNQYPMTDERGIAQANSVGNTGNTLTFTVGATINGTITLNYDLGFDFTGLSNTLTNSDIKYHLTKNGTPVTPCTASAGTLVNSRASIQGTHGLINNFAISSGSFSNANGSDTYVLRLWVKSDYQLPDNTSYTDVAIGTCVNGGNTTYDKTEAECGAGTWTATGTAHRDQTLSKSYSVKIKVVGAQA